MKYSLVLPLALTTLTLTSCTLIPGNNNTTCAIDTDCKKTEMCYFNPGGTVGSCIGKTELPGADDSFDQVPSTTEENFITSTSIPANSKNNTPTNPQDNTPKPTVSTEDLTKELDAFVDDITKGL